MYDTPLILGPQTLTSRLIVGTGKHCEPMFDMRSSSPRGFDIDLAREVAKRIGKQRVSFRSFTSSRRIAARGEVDMAIQAISIKPEREREHLFSSPYLESSFVVIANQYQVGLRSRDLAGKVCAVWPNRVYESELRRTGCSMTNFKTKVAALNAVRSGEVDFTVTDEANATVLVEDSGGRLTQPGIFLNSDRYGIVMKLGNYELKRGVDQALEDMRRDGTLRSLRGKYGI